jgi:hypothetical protein
MICIGSSGMRMCHLQERFRSTVLRRATSSLFEDPHCVPADEPDTQRDLHAKGHRTNPRAQSDVDGVRMHMSHLPPSPLFLPLALPFMPNSILL